MVWVWLAAVDNAPVPSAIALRLALPNTCNAAVEIVEEIADSKVLAVESVAEIDDKRLLI